MFYFTSNILFWTIPGYKNQKLCGKSKKVNCAQDLETTFNIFLSLTYWLTRLSFFNFIEIWTVMSILMLEIQNFLFTFKKVFYKKYSKYRNPNKKLHEIQNVSSEISINVMTNQFTMFYPLIHISPTVIMFLTNAVLFDMLWKISHTFFKNQFRTRSISVWTCF